MSFECVHARVIEWVSGMPTQQLHVSAVVGFLCAVVYFWNSKGNAYDIVTWNNLNSQKTMFEFQFVFKPGRLPYPGLPLLWNQREKWLLFQVLTKEKWETTGRSGESAGRSQNISIINCTTFHIHGALSWHSYVIMYLLCIKVYSVVV